MIYNYTIDSDEGGLVDIIGDFIHGANTSDFRIFMTTDNDLNLVDTSNLVPLYAGLNSTSHVFNETVNVAPGNDILFVADNYEVWFQAFTLDATITPEPTTFALLGLGMLLSRRCRR